MEESLGVDGAEEDVVASFLRNEDKEVLPGVKGTLPSFGQCFPSFETADAFVRRHGARSVPYRKANGGGKNTHTYVCKHTTLSSFSKRPPQKKKGSAAKVAKVAQRGGLRIGIGADVLKSKIVQDIVEGRKSNKCCGLVQAQRCNVESLVRGSYAKSALSKWLHLCGGLHGEEQPKVDKMAGMWTKYPQLQQRPKGLAARDVVFAVTEYIPHTCLGDGKSCNEVVQSEEDAGGGEEDNEADGEDEGEDNVSDDEEEDDKEDDGEEEDGEEGDGEEDDGEEDEVDEETVTNPSASASANCDSRSFVNE